MINFYKSTLIIFIILLLAKITIAQPQGHIDERFELTSIVFRLTEDVAFYQSNPESYLTDIDKYFAKYKNHELIDFIKKTMYSKSTLDISWPMYFASDIQITPDGIVWTQEWCSTFEQYDTLSDNIIWTKSEMHEYLRLLNKFYNDTKFKKFYSNHTTFYQNIEHAFQEISTRIDTAWFQNFFGIPFKLDNIWIVPANGHGNFSILKIDTNGTKHHNCAISGVLIDTFGNPFFHENIFTTLIHEICHNYNNPICERHMKEFQHVCDTLFRFVGDRLSKGYYGSSEAIMYEGFNRLCECSYFKEKNLLTDSALHFRSMINITDGFFWFEDMLRYMDVFFQNRETFKTFEDFLPSLRHFLEHAVNLMEHYYCPKYDLISPCVVATYPEHNMVVDTDIDAIIIKFSQPMQPILSVYQSEDETAFPLPIDNTKIYWSDKYTYVMPLKERLMPNTKYGYHVKYFASDVNFYGCTPYDFVFKTR